MIAATITRPDLAATRPGIRFGLIDEALAPLNETLMATDPAGIARLRQDLVAVVSAEALFVLTDLAGLAPEETIASLVRSAATLTEAAVTEAAATAVTPASLTGGCAGAGVISGHPAGAPAGQRRRWPTGRPGRLAAGRRGRLWVAQEAALAPDRVAPCLPSPCLLNLCLLNPGPLNQCGRHWHRPRAEGGGDQHPGSHDHEKRWIDVQQPGGVAAQGRQVEQAGQDERLPGQGGLTSRGTGRHRS